MSATFNEDVQTLKELVLHNPVSGAAETETQVSELVDPSQRKLLVLAKGLFLLGMSFLILSH